MDSPELYSLPRYISDRSNLLLMIKIRETHEFQKREACEGISPSRITRIIKYYGGHSDEQLLRAVNQLTEIIESVLARISLEDLKKIMP